MILGDDTKSCGLSVVWSCEKCSATQGDSLVTSRDLLKVLILRQEVGDREERRRRIGLQCYER